jgi:3'(2'), 5'-bisphosphate nucleotidase
MSQAPTNDHALAAELATSAGRLLVDLRARRAADAVDPKALGREGDAEAHELLMAGLAEARPGDAVLSEEGLADPARLTAERVWIVDPLDGTREYGEVPRRDWAVHVALVVGGEPVAGAVALPARDLTLATDPPPPPAPPWEGPPRVLVSRSRPPVEATRVAEALGGELVPLGSAGAKAMAVVLGEADVYAHSGGQYEWDSAAPVAVARAAGLHVSRLDGSPLVYNRPDPYLPDLLICRPELAGRVIAAAR